MGKRIEVQPYRPKKVHAATVSDQTVASIRSHIGPVENALEAYKAAERAKVLARVKKHRAKKAAKT